MKERYAIAHMQAAYVYADLSYCIRKKVGCVIVKDGRLISIGFNGTPPGRPNVCEDEAGNTLPEVYHAEANAISKLAKSTGGGSGSSVFVTIAPCLYCAKELANMEIQELYYCEEYRDTAGVDFLRMSDIPVIKLNIPFRGQNQQ